MAFKGDAWVFTPEQQAVRRALESRVWHVRISERRDEWGRPMFTEGDAGLPDYVPGSEDLVGVVIGPVWGVTVQGEAYTLRVMLDCVERPAFAVERGRVTGVMVCAPTAHPNVRGLVVNGPAPSCEPDPEPIVVGG